MSSAQQYAFKLMQDFNKYLERKVEKLDKQIKEELYEEKTNK